MAVPVVYYGPETFTIVSKKPVSETRVLSNGNFEYCENFVLVVRNGISGRTKVSKLEIMLDGAIVVSHADFKGNKNIINKPLSSLTPQSVLEVKLVGNKDRFITISVEGTLRSNVISDVDGNYYKTVEICGRWWMAENLRAIRFNDGTPVLFVTDNDVWKSTNPIHTPAYCWYNNDPAFKSIYGALYNQGAVDGGNGKNICPAGWHIPVSEWGDMIHCLDPETIDWGVMSETAGDKLKEAGIIHWNCPENFATNETGFTALPGGIRYINEPFFTHIGAVGFFWGDKGYGKFRMYCGSGAVAFSEGGDDYGLSVRCVKDSE